MVRGVERVLPSLSLLLVLFASLADLGFTQTSQNISRDDFPSEFVFGAGTSSYQVEGAVAEDGRTPSIWDTFTHEGWMPDKSNADVAADGYHKYKEDVKLMVDTGLEAYRFSISWSRLLPNGRGAVNPKGLMFYNNLIDELVKHGIQPHVTIYHLDLPQVLEDEYGGWLSPKIIDDFKEYADVCFREFGDRVSHWTTLNEPNTNSMGAYDMGILPPHRCSLPFGSNCSGGNSTVEPYTSTHHSLLAHAAAVDLYRTKYQVMQNGKIGANVYTVWFDPISNFSADIEATQRVRDFQIGWVLNPLVFGDYPETMKKNVGQRLPSFTKTQAEQVKGSFDFIGLNHYMSLYVKDNPDASKRNQRDFNLDMLAIMTDSKDGTPGSQFAPTHKVTDASGLQKMLEYLKQAYGNPTIYVQENGYGMGVNKSRSPLIDPERINFLSSFMASMLQAIRNGADVRGYFVWSFMDVFELLGGYENKMGLYFVDFKDDERKRHPKLSAYWYSNFLKKKNNDINIQAAGLQRVPYADH